MIRKELGKIQFIRVGYGGYDEAMWGVTFTLGGEKWGVGDFWGTWGFPPAKDAKWTEQDRLNSYADVMLRLLDLCKKAKVKDVADLKGIPVEVTFEDRVLKEWRILEEVL